MHKFILIVLFNFLISSVNAQLLSLDNLISLRQKDPEEVEEFLLKRNWEFTSSKIEDDTSCAIAAFKTKFTNKAKLEVLQYLYSSSDSIQRIWYTCFTKGVYTNLLARCKLLGFKLLGSKIGKDVINRAYSKKGLVIIFRTFAVGNSPNTILMYKIELYTETDYYKILPF